MSTIFSKIIGGQIPAYKIWENEFVYAFLDAHPIQAGHTLLVPKIELDYFFDLPEPYYLEIFKAAKPIARAIQEATKCARVGTIIEGFVVAHAHYHLVPMFKPDDLFGPQITLSGDEMTDIQKKIIANL